MMKLCKKKDRNVFRLSIILRTFNAIEKELKKYLNDNSVEAMNALKTSLEKHYAYDSSRGHTMNPVVDKMLRAIETFKQTGERPNLILKK